MGLRKLSELSEAQLAQIGANAAERFVDMHPVYVVSLAPLQRAHWDDVIGAIESEGWRLEHFTLDRDGYAVAVFRAVR